MLNVSSSCFGQQDRRTQTWREASLNPFHVRNLESSVIRYATLLYRNREPGCLHRCVIHVWRIYVRLREGGSCGTIDMKIRFTSPNPGLKLKGVNYKSNKTGLLFNLSGGRAPALRLIELGGHQSNTSGTDVSEKQYVLIQQRLSAISRQLSFINTWLYLFHSVWGDVVTEYDSKWFHSSSRYNLAENIIKRAWLLWTNSFWYRTWPWRWNLRITDPSRIPDNLSWLLEDSI